MGTTQRQELTEAPQKAESERCGSLRPRPWPKGNSSWFRFGLGSSMAGQVICISVCFSLVQQGAGGHRAAPRAGLLGPASSGSHLPGWGKRADPHLPASLSR